jgi:hypothetical protein
MESRPRADIYINLPALRKLDSMLMVVTTPEQEAIINKIDSVNIPHKSHSLCFLQEALDSFQKTEFWYAEEGSLSMKSTRSATGSFRKVIVQRKEEKWWLPIPLVPLQGLSEKARKQLKSKRESTNQIHKAAMAINSSILGEMDIPDSYMATLPKVTTLKMILKFWFSIFGVIFLLTILCICRAEKRAQEMQSIDT